MLELYDFYRNVTYFEEYDEYSFIGIWLDYARWDDNEYWKLEDSLLFIAKNYKQTGYVSQEILLGITRIIQVLMVPNWSDFSFLKDGNSDIYDRFERVKYVISQLFSKEDIVFDDFCYRSQREYILRSNWENSE